MKKTLAMLLSAAMVLGLVVAGSPSSAQAASNESSTAEETATPIDPESVTGDPVNINYAAQDAPSSAKGLLEQSFFDNLNAASNGLITVTPFWSGSLVKSASAWTELTAGTCDAVTTVPGNELDHFIVEAASSYFLASNLPFDKAIEAAKELYYQTPDWQAEFENIIPLTWDSSGGQLYIMSNVPIESLEDIKGKSFRCVEQNVVELIEALGGVAISMPLSEVVDSISKGIISGTVQSIHNMVTGNFMDVCDYATGLDMIAPICTKRFMSKAKYDEMSETEKAAFDSALEQFRSDVGQFAIDQEQNALKACEEGGVTIFTLSDEEIAKIWELNTEFSKKKAEELDAAGYAGTEMYENALSIIEKYSE